MAKNKWPIKDSANYMNLPTVRNTLEIVDKLTDGKHLSKTFDINIACG